MRASAIPIAITLTLAPLPALPFDQDEFCVAVSDIVRHLNACKGRWLDRTTRHDGAEIDCEAKTVEAERFVDADPDDMREGWEARKERQWNAAYCNDDSWREDAGPSREKGRQRSVRACQTGRRCSDSQSPPPIKAAPDRRPSTLARTGFMNQPRPRPEAIAQPVSVVAAMSTVTAHITVS